MVEREARLRIGELARRAEISRDTIRFYEKNGLITSQPSSSETNSFRNYPEEAVLTLELIKEAQAAGFTLAELLVFIRQLETSDKDDFDGEAFLDHKIEEVEARIERSQRFLQTLRMTKASLQ